MYEAIPVGAGLVLAFFVYRIPDTKIRAAIISVASILIGILATWIAGEEKVLVLFDIAQVAFASVVGLMLMKRFVAAPNRNKHE